MSDTVQLIKDKLSIVDVVAPYVKLAKAGKYWRGLSPFNKEKTPSFFVSPDRGTYYCFSSGQGGDLFTFVEKMEGVDFKGALKILAEKAGVPLTYARSGNREKTERLREAMARAEQCYQANADEKSEAYRYALSRGLTKETITLWNLGYAKEAWRDLLEHLGGVGFSTEEMLAAGLIKEADGKPGTYYDRFRNRLMFPIRDAAGRTVAFTGRALAKDEQAKYLNSPETELYKKSEILFGMDQAKDAIRTRGFAILVEGQMDLLHAHQAGFANTVALSGTALSGTHLSLMKRYSENLMLALDADRAGLSASAKSALAALGAGMRVKAIRMPQGKDPADVIAEDPKAFAKLVADAKPIIEFFLAVLASDINDTHRLVLAVERTVLPLVAAVQSPLEREHFVGVVARALSTTPEAVRGALARLPREADAGHGEGSDSPAREKSVPSLRYSATETAAIALAAAAIGYADTPLAKHVESEYARIKGAPLPKDAVPEEAIFESGLSLGESPSEHAADELIARFEKATCEEAYEKALVGLRRAQAAKDQQMLSAAEQECATIMKRLASLS